MGATGFLSIYRLPMELKNIEVSSAGYLRVSTPVLLVTRNTLFISRGVLSPGICVAFNRDLCLVLSGGLEAWDNPIDSKLSSTKTFEV